MNDKKKPAPGTANTENGKGQEIVGTISGPNSTTKAEYISTLFEHLGKGKGEAVPMDRLSGVLGVSERRLRRIIADARKHGALILSCEAGYFLPDMSTEEGRTDFLHYVRTMKARAKHSWACAYVAEKAFIGGAEDG